jgi:hypothetical protein
VAEGGGALDQVLAVIEHQQQVARSQRGDKHRFEVAPGFLLKLENCGDLLGYAARIEDSGQVDEPHTIGIVVRQNRCRFERQSSFSNAAWTGQGEQARAAGQLREDFTYLALARNKAAGRLPTRSRRMATSPGSHSKLATLGRQAALVAQDPSAPSG